MNVYRRPLTPKEDQQAIQSLLEAAGLFRGMSANYAGFVFLTLLSEDEQEQNSKEQQAGVPIKERLYYLRWQAVQKLLEHQGFWCEHFFGI